ncbi:MAG: hypothetical protein JO006_19620 [Paucibacter sp.]|nr:hypothetical protein [Roseateles sp.]
MNDVPVIEFDTPTGDCFVVPRSMVGNLEVLGVNPANAMTMTWERIDDERLNLIVEWTAQLN